MRKLILAVFIITLSGMAALASEPLEIMFVLDNSGSMKLNDPQFHTGKFVAEFIENVSLEARVGMIVFDSETRVILPLTSVTEPDIRDRVSRGLDNLNYQGQWTCSPAAIERGLYELKHSGTGNARRMIIFLTDGLVDTGDPARDGEQLQWLTDNLTADALKNGIRLFCIAFTESADYQLLQTLAQKTDGEYYRAMQVADIQTILDSVYRAIVPRATETAGGATTTPTPSTADLMVAILAELQSKTGLIIGGFIIIVFILMILLFRRRQPTPRIIVSGNDNGAGTGRGFAPVDGTKPKNDTPIWKKPEDDGPGQADPPLKKEPDMPVGEKDEPMWDGPDSDDSHSVDSETPDPPVKETLAPAREPTHPISTRGGSEGKLSPAVLEDLGNVTGQAIYNLTRPTIRIGRNEKLNDIAIPERTVSKQHAVIEFKDNMFYLIDLRSANGTFLNHRRFSDPGKVMETPLKNGDRITFDVFEFQFLVDDEQPVDRTLLRPIDYPAPQKKSDPSEEASPAPEFLPDTPSDAANSALVETTKSAIEEPPETTVVETTLLSRKSLENITAGGITDDLSSDEETLIHDDSGNPFPETDEPVSCYNHPDKIGLHTCDICAYDFCTECIQEDSAGCVCKECARLI